MYGKSSGLLITEVRINMAQNDLAVSWSKGYYNLESNNFGREQISNSSTSQIWRRTIDNKTQLKFVSLINNNSYRGPLHWKVKAKKNLRMHLPSSFSTAHRKMESQDRLCKAEAT